MRACFGAFAEGVAGGLELRHDHGSQFVADDFHRELGFLGIAPSPAFVGEPAGNGWAERFIRTLKENLLWVRRFATLEELRQALHASKDTYNRTWIIERHGYQTPLRPSERRSLRRSQPRHEPQRGVSQSWTRYSVTDAYVCRLLPLICFARDIVEAILDGRQPKGLRLADVRC